MYIAFFNDGTWIASENESGDENFFYFYAYDWGTWSVKNGEITMVNSATESSYKYDETYTVKLNGSELTIENNCYSRGYPYYEKIVYEKLSSNPNSFEYYYD